MVKKRSNYIIFFSWFLVLVLLWIVISFFEGVNGQWWSMYRLNPDEYGPWALEVSYIKVSIAAVISLVIAYMVSFGFKSHK
jgi:ABC-type Fe3+ transport system permease subunit